MQPPTGKSAVIIGNGPSADVIPPKFWQDAESDPDCLLIGTNRALVMKCLQDVKIDVMVIRDHPRSLFADQAYGSQYHIEYWKGFPGWKIGPANRRHCTCDEFVRFESGWQHERKLDCNHEAAVLLQNTVVLMAANWAWQQGCHEITFVGVDYGPGPEGTGHAEMIAPWNSFLSEASPMQYAKRIAGTTELEFHNVAKVIKQAGGTLLNYSPYTRLASVEIHPLAKKKRKPQTAVSTAPDASALVDANMPDLGRGKIFDPDADGGEDALGDRPPEDDVDPPAPKRVYKGRRNAKQRKRRNARRPSRATPKPPKPFLSDDYATAGAKLHAKFLKLDLSAVESIVPAGGRITKTLVKRYYEARRAEDAAALSEAS